MLKTQEYWKFSSSIHFSELHQFSLTVICLCHTYFLISICNDPPCMGSFSLQKETKRSRGGTYFPFEMFGRMYNRMVKGAKALPGWYQPHGVVDRLKDRPAIQRHSGRLAKMAKSSTWDKITPYGTTDWRSFSEEVCTSSWGHHKLGGINTRLLRLRLESWACEFSKAAGVMFQIAL